MGLSRLVAFLTLLALLVVFAEGTYLLRWMTVLLFGLILAIILFGWELGLPQIGLEGGSSVTKRRDEVESLAKLIDRAKKGRVARGIIADMVVEIYSLTSENHGEVYRRLRSEPNEPLKLIMSDGDFLENLESALDAVEADLNED